MKHIISQVRRMFNDDGRNDKVFHYQEYKLKAALIKLKDATNEVIRASGRLQDILGSDRTQDPFLH